MKVLFSLLIVICTTLSISAQNTGQVQPEMGKPSELKGLTKIFVTTEADEGNRKRIIEEIKKAKLPDVVILDSEEGAEIGILFSSAEKKSFAGSINREPFSKNVSRSRAVYNGQLTGVGTVFIRAADGKTFRLLLRVESTQDQAFEKKPATKFAQEFIKIYREVNGIPDK